MSGFIKCFIFLNKYNNCNNILGSTVLQLHKLSQNKCITATFSSRLSLTGMLSTLTLFKRVKTTLCGYSRSDTITPPNKSDLTKTWQTYSAKKSKQLVIKTMYGHRNEMELKVVQDGTDTVLNGSSLSTSFKVSSEA